MHGLVTTLKTALIHPVVQNLPFDLGTSAAVFRNLHAALGLVNINFSDHRREGNRVTLEADPAGRRVLIHYRPAADEPGGCERQSAFPEAACGSWDVSRRRP